MAIAIDKALEKCGWTLVRQKKHEVWKCPCGGHQITKPKTPSDWRSDKNTLSDLMGTDCPSLAALEEEPEAPPDTRGWPQEWKDGKKPACHFCRKVLEPRELGKTFYHHGGMAACKRHPGVRAWHDAESKKEREDAI